VTGQSRPWSAQGEGRRLQRGDWGSRAPRQCRTHWPGKST